MVGNLKAQSSIEFMLVFGIGLALIVGAFVVASNYSAQNLGIAQAQDAVNKLASAADYVYTLGPNSKLYVDVFFPKEYDSIDTTGRRVSMTLSMPSGKTDIFANTKSDILDAMPKMWGPQRILVQYLPSGKILLGEDGLECSPPAITITDDPGKSGSKQFTITNLLDATITGINATVLGSVNGTVAAPTVPSTLSAGSTSSQIALPYSIPSNQIAGGYSGNVVVTSSNGSCALQLYVNVNANSSCGSFCAAYGYASGSNSSSAPACIASGGDYRPFGSMACCCSPSQDSQGPMVSSASHSPFSPSISDNITFFATCNDTLTGNSYISSARFTLDGGAWNDLYAATSFNTAPVMQASAQLPPIAVPGQHILDAQCADSAGNFGPIRRYYFNTTMGDYIGPIITTMSSAGNSTLTTNVTITGHASDTYVGNHAITGCKMAIDLNVTNPNPNNPAFFSVPASDGAYDSPEEDFTYSVSGLAIKWHNAIVYCTDAANNTGGMYNFTFGIKAADIMLVMDVSGSMAWTVTNFTNDTVMTTNSTDFLILKSLPVDVKNGDMANLTVETRKNQASVTISNSSAVGISNTAFLKVKEVYAVPNLSATVSVDIMGDTYTLSSNPVAAANNTTAHLVKSIAGIDNTSVSLSVDLARNSSCNSATAYYEIRRGATVLASGSRSQTSYNTYTTNNVDLSQYPGPVTLDLYIYKTGGSSGCWAALARNFIVTPRCLTTYEVREGAANTLLTSGSTSQTSWQTTSAPVDLSSFSPSSALGLFLKTSNSLCTAQAQNFQASYACGPAYYEVRVGSDVLAYNNTPGTSYVPRTNTPINISNYTAPFSLSIYMRGTGGGCTVNNRDFDLTQLPTKISAARAAASNFVDQLDNTSQAGLARFSTTAYIVNSPTGELHIMDASNKTSLKNAINGLTPDVSTCIECGLNVATDELLSARSRYTTNGTAIRIAVLMTDGMGNVGNTLTGAYYAKSANVIVYTIGFGADVSELELRGVADLTGGKYYYAPDVATLNYIFTHIGE